MIEKDKEVQYMNKNHRQAMYITFIYQKGVIYE